MPRVDPSPGVVPEYLWRDRSTSTNAELLDLARERELADFTTLATDHQSEGRGRLGRSWAAPAGRSLAISVAFRPRLPGGEPLPIERFGWLPLAAGLAMLESVAVLLPGRSPQLKWPNDLLVGGAKLCGVLAELASSGDRLVIGAGINTTMSADERPVPTATSLALEGAIVDDEVLAGLLTDYLRRLRDHITGYLGLGGDAQASGLHELVTAACSTLGKEVRVELPGAEPLRGVATDLDAAGRLRVRRGSDGRVVTVAAGDVTHLRYE